MKDGRMGKSREDGRMEEGRRYNHELGHLYEGEISENIGRFKVGKSENSFFGEVINESLNLYHAVAAINN